MRDRMDEFDGRLEAYLDGELAGEDLAAFEAALAADPTKRRELELHRRIDSSMKRMFSPGVAVLPVAHHAPVAAIAGEPAIAEPVADVPEVAGVISPASQSAAPGRRKSSARMALLAASLLIGAGLIYYFGPVGPGSGLLFGDRGGAGTLADNTPHRPTVESYYKELVDTGFKPLAVCTNDAEFRQWTSDRLGTKLSMKPDSSVTLVGWTYGLTPMSDDTSVLLAKVDGKEVVVLMDRKSGGCRSVRASRSKGLHVFSRTVGEITMYEITPAETSGIIERMEAVGA